MPLHVVPKQATPRKPSRTPKLDKVPRLVEILECHRCRGREVIQTVIGATMVKGKLKGGTPQVLCACCLLNGDRVVLA